MYDELLLNAISMKSEQSICLHRTVDEMSVMCQISIIARFWSYDMPFPYVCKELLGIYF